MLRETKVISISLWELCQEEMEKQGWQAYGYEPLPVPTVVNLEREIKE